MSKNIKEFIIIGFSLIFIAILLAVSAYIMNEQNHRHTMERINLEYSLKNR